MTAPTIIERLRAHGVSVRAEVDKLVFEAAAPPPAEARPLIEELRARKAEALRALQSWDEAEAHRLMCGLPVRIHAAHGGRHIPMSPEAAQALDTLYRLREKRLDMAAFKQAREHYLTLRLAQAGDPEPGPAPAGWDERKAGELLLSAQERLRALLGDRPIPEMDLLVSSAYDRLAEAHDARRWADFEQAVIDFDRAWRERICRH